MFEPCQYFNYPIKLTSEKEGGYSVLFPDIPEAITQGDTLEEALAEAEDCLEEAIANRIAMKLDIPMPSKPRKSQHIVTLNVTLAAKAALYLTMRTQKLNNSRLAKRLECDEKEVRRLLDPYYSSKLPRIEHALEVMGQRLSVGLMG